MVENTEGNRTPGKNISCTCVQVSLQVYVKQKRGCRLVLLEKKGRRSDFAIGSTKKKRVVGLTVLAGLLADPYSQASSHYRQARDLLPAPCGAWAGSGLIMQPGRHGLIRGGHVDAMLTPDLVRAPAQHRKKNFSRFFFHGDIENQPPVIPTSSYPLQPTLQSSWSYRCTPLHPATIKAANL